MHLSTVEPLLEYQVKATTHFCFNVEAVHWPTQKILSERLAVSSGVAMHSFTDEASGIARVRKIVRWIRDSIAYQPGSTHSTTTAQEVFVQRTGVCGDAKDVAFSTFYGPVGMTRMEIIVLEHEPRRAANSGKAVVELAATGSA